MIQPVFYNIFCCFIIVLASTYAGIYILKKRKEDREAMFFAFFWLAMAFTWLCIGFYTLFLPSINKPLVYGGQVFIAISFIFLTCYFSYKIWGKIYKWSFFLFLLIDSFYIFSVFYISFPQPLITDWGVVFPIPPLVFVPIVLLFGTGLFLGFFDIFKRISRWIKTKKFAQTYKFFATLSIILYIFAGFFDEWVIHYGGIKLFLIRILEMFSALLAYLCYSGEIFDKENFIE